MLGQQPRAHRIPVASARRQGLATGIERRPRLRTTGCPSVSEHLPETSRDLAIEGQFVRCRGRAVDPALLHGQRVGGYDDPHARSPCSPQARDICDGSRAGNVSTASECAYLVRLRSATIGGRGVVRKGSAEKCPVVDRGCFGRSRRHGGGARREPDQGSHIQRRARAAAVVIQSEPSRSPETAGRSLG